LEKNTRSYRKFRDLLTSRGQKNQITHFYKQDVGETLKQESFHQETGITTPDLLTLKDKLLRDNTVKKEEPDYSVEKTKRAADLEYELNALRKLRKSDFQQQAPQKFLEFAPST